MEENCKKVYREVRRSEDCLLDLHKENNIFEGFRCGSISKKCFDERKAIRTLP